MSGGSIRDFFMGQKPNDIDLVVSGSYAETKKFINDFFVSRGVLLNEQTLITSKAVKKFGQMKIMNVCYKQVLIYEC